MSMKMPGHPTLGLPEGHRNSPQPLSTCASRDSLMGMATSWDQGKTKRSLAPIFVLHASNSTQSTKSFQIIFFHAKRKSLSNDENILTSSSTSLGGESYKALALGGWNSITLSKNLWGKTKQANQHGASFQGLTKGGSQSACSNEMHGMGILHQVTEIFHCVSPTLAPGGFPGPQSPMFATGSLNGHPGAGSYSRNTPKAAAQRSFICPSSLKHGPNFLWSPMCASQENRAIR